MQPVRSRRFGCIDYWLSGRRGMGSRLGKTSHYQDPTLELSLPAEEMVNRDYTPIK